MTEPSFVHVGPSGSVPETTFMTSIGPQLLPSSVKDPHAHPLTPCGAIREFPAVDTPFAACTGGHSAVSHAEHRGSDLVHVWWRDRACRHLLSIPFPTIDACPGIGPHIRALSAPPGLRMPLPWPLYIPPLSAWQWPGRDVGSSPVTGQPAQLAPPPGSSAPTMGFPDTVGRSLTVCLPQFQAVVPGTRPSSPPTPVVSTVSMPRPRSPADVEVRNRMDFTPVPGGPRPLPPAQGFPLPSSIQPLPMSSPSTGLPGVQDFARLQTTWRQTTQLHLQEKAGLPAVSSVARSGPDPLLDMQSILATMQDTFLQQVKDLLGVAPPQPSLSPSVLTDMGQDVLRQPSPAGDREALRAGPNSGSKRARESSRSCIKSGDLSPSERRDWRSRDSCCHSLSSHDTPYRSRSRSLLPSGIESVVGCHHSRSLSGSWRTSPPGCRGSRSRSPASFRWRRSPSPTRWPSPKRRSSASQTRWPSPQRRYSPFQSRCSSSRHRSPRSASSHHSRSSSRESCHQNRGLNSVWPTTSADQRMLLLSAVPSRHSVHDDDREAGVSRQELSGPYTGGLS